ncbi:MAG: glycosyltransferase family 2 protein, partial [Candidatus Promineifilaceae bacterium]|nr:glycosyltransferase family 2 protein [Candidatus Promineifilaceae bacterium]
MLSVVIPVFNEHPTIGELLGRVQAVPIEKEVIIVDDCSTDGTRMILNNIDEPNVRIVYHQTNRGKGAAVQTGFQYVMGNIVIVQDADLEYDPQDYLTVVQPILSGEADVVYGSRFLGDHQFKSPSHYFGNRFLTWLTNRLYACNLTDMETCYKAIRSEVLREIALTATGFEFEPELTGK